MQRKQRKKQDEKRNEKLQVKPFRSETDVLGSYTGVPSDRFEIPVQDADDL